MAERIGRVVVIALLVLLIVTFYRNVFADDTAVRALADKQARAACGAGCEPIRMAGERGMITESFEITFQNATTVSVKCRRAYIAFGAYDCTAAKR